MKLKYRKGEVCPTCMKSITSDQKTELNIETGVVRHASCAELRPMQKKALEELGVAMQCLEASGV